MQGRIHAVVWMKLVESNTFWGTIVLIVEAFPAKQLCQSRPQEQTTLSLWKTSDPDLLIMVHKNVFRSCPCTVGRLKRSLRYKCRFLPNKAEQ
jgi:hypothetical protein